MAYNSAYTGQEIDAAIGAVKNKESTWDGKQDKLIGQQGQVVGFDESGNAVAQDAPQSGLSQEQADERYLKLTGGVVDGVLQIGTGKKESAGGKIVLVDFNSFAMLGGTVEKSFSIKDDVFPQEEGASLVGQGYWGLSFSGPISINGSNDGCSLIVNGTINGVQDPIYSVDAANKRYVDSKVPKSIAVTLTASGWTDNAQTVAVNGVLADETKQEIHPMPATATAGNQDAYVAAGIMCTAQGANSLTFTCSTVPTQDIDMYITITEVTAG